MNTGAFNGKVMTLISNKIWMVKYVTQNISP